MAVYERSFDVNAAFLVTGIVLGSLIYGTMTFLTAYLLIVDPPRLVDNLFNWCRLRGCNIRIIRAAIKTLVIGLASLLWPFTLTIGGVAYFVSIIYRGIRNKPGNGQELRVIPEGNEQQQPGQTARNPRRQSKTRDTKTGSQLPPVYRPYHQRKEASPYPATPETSFAEGSEAEQGGSNWRCKSARSCVLSVDTSLRSKCVNFLIAKKV